MNAIGVLWLGCGVHWRKLFDCLLLVACDVVATVIFWWELWVVSEAAHLCLKFKLVCYSFNSALEVYSEQNLQTLQLFPVPWPAKLWSWSQNSKPPSHHNCTGHGRKSGGSTNSTVGCLAALRLIVAWYCVRLKYISYYMSLATRTREKIINTLTTTAKESGLVIFQCHIVEEITSCFYYVMLNDRLFWTRLS